MKLEAESKGYNLPYCTCGDSMTTYKELNEKGMIVRHRYHCFGCDAWFVLVPINPPTEVRGETNEK